MWVLSHGPPPTPALGVAPHGLASEQKCAPSLTAASPRLGHLHLRRGPSSCWGWSQAGSVLGAVSVWGVSGRFSLGGWRLLQHLRAVCPCDSVSEEWFPRGGFVTATASQTIRRGGTLTGLRLAPGPPVPVSLDNYNPPTPPWPRRVQERRRGGQARVPIPAGYEGGELMGTLSLCRAVTLGGLSPSVSGTEGLLFAKEREQLT